jgi:hypothetical protein
LTTVCSVVVRLFGRSTVLRAGEAGPGSEPSVVIRIVAPEVPVDAPTLTGTLGAPVSIVVPPGGERFGVSAGSCGTPHVTLMRRSRVKPRASALTMSIAFRRQLGRLAGAVYVRVRDAVCVEPRAPPAVQCGIDPVRLSVPPAVQVIPQETRGRRPLKETSDSFAQVLL